VDTTGNTYFVYVLYSSKFDQIYIGQTNNLKIRFQKHNSGKVKSTKAYIPWGLLHFEEFNSRAEAMSREKQLKSHRGREFIRKLISVGRVRQLPD